MSSQFVVGIDIGGTNIRGVLSNETGEFLRRVKEKVDTEDEMALSGQIVSITRRLCEEEQIEVESLEGIGIASTGPMKREEGILVEPSNLPFDRIPLTGPVVEELGMSVSLLNDCIAGVLGERYFGAGKEDETENLVYVNMGTGIGGGAIVDSHVLFGYGGNAAEIGHITVDPEMRLRCGCGKRGHWEAYCSGRNIPNFVRLKFDELGDAEAKKSYLYKLYDGDLSKITAKDFFEAVKKGDDFAEDVLKKINMMNILGVGDVIDLYAPSLVTIGGSVALKNPDIIVPPIRDRVKEHIRNLEPEIMLSQLGEDIGLYGAVAEALSLR